MKTLTSKQRQLILLLQQGKKLHVLYKNKIERFCIYDQALAVWVNPRTITSLINLNYMDKWLNYTGPTEIKKIRRKAKRSNQRVNNKQ